MILAIFRKKRKERKYIPLGALGPYDLRKIELGWGEVEQLIQVGRPSAMKEAVIKADKLLAYALVRVSSGATLGTQLKNARRKFSPKTYQGLWDAHKVRNSLVHDADFDLTNLIAREVLGKYKAAFKTLGANI